MGKDTNIPVNRLRRVFHINRKIGTNRPIYNIVMMKVTSIWHAKRQEMSNKCIRYAFHKTDFLQTISVTYPLSQSQMAGLLIQEQ